MAGITAAGPLPPACTWCWQPTKDSRKKQWERSSLSAGNFRSGLPVTAQKTPKNMMLHKTKGIVLRSVKYGETSLVVTIFTELFGLQSYLVNGVRTVPKKGTAKANLFQPA